MKEVTIVKIGTKWCLVNTAGLFFKSSVPKDISNWGYLDSDVTYFLSIKAAKELCTTKDFQEAREEKLLISDYLVEHNLVYLFERQGQGYEMLIVNSLVTDIKTDYEEWETPVTSEFIENGYGIFVCQEKEILFLVEFPKFQDLTLKQVKEINEYTHPEDVITFWDVCMRYGKAKKIRG